MGIPIYSRQFAPQPPSTLVPFSLPIPVPPTPPPLWPPGPLPPSNSSSSLHFNTCVRVATILPPSSPSLPQSPDPHPCATQMHLPQLFPRLIYLFFALHCHAALQTGCMYTSVHRQVGSYLPPAGVEDFVLFVPDAKKVRPVIKDTAAAQATIKCDQGMVDVLH